MIFIDPTELRETSLLGDLGNIPHQPLQDLEHYTGADLMLSPVDFPATTETLMRRHIEQGAILVQRKSGLDLTASIGERMGHSLTRMRAMGARQSQCLLLFIGVLTCNREDKAVVDGRDTFASFWSVQGAISKWHDRGGVFESLSRASLMADWCRMKLRHLKEYAEEPIHQVWPAKPDLTSTDNPLQLPQAINDGRVTLATLPGLGPARVQAIWDYLQPDTTLATALCLLSNPESHIKDIDGIGPKTIQNVRQYLGLDEVMQLTFEVRAKYQ